MFKREKGYPLWKVEYEEQLYHDVLSKEYTIYVKPHSMVPPIKLYMTNSLPKIQVALERLKDMYDILIERVLVDMDNQPAMFEVHNQIYATTGIVISQSCICGEIIEGNKCYGAIEEDYDLKFDYTQDYIFFYKKGECLVKGNQVFLDGLLILNENQLFSLCDEIGQNIDQLETQPYKLLKWLATNYSNAKTYICGGSTYFDVGGYIDG